MGDFNENITSTQLQDWSSELGLFEMTLASIQTNQGTHCLNQQECQIDGIFSDLPLAAAGMTNFGMFEHCTLWMTLLLTTAFGFHYQPPRPLPIRRLYLHKVNAVDWYHASLSDSILQTDLLCWVLRVTMQTPTALASAVLNCLDVICQDIMLQAEKDCSKLSKGEIPYSPTLGLLGKRIYVAKLILQKLSRPSHISLRCIDCLCCVTQLSMGWQCMLVDEACDLVSTSKMEYQNFKKQSHVSRDTHLLSLLAKAREEHDVLRERHIWRIISTEQQRRYHKEIGWNYCQQARVIFWIQTPGPGPDQWVNHVEENDIVRECIQVNKKKYSKVYNTMLMKEDWRDRIGADGDGLMADDILNGTVSEELLSQLPSGAAQFLRELQAPPNMTIVWEKVDAERNKRNWSHVKEGISSGPSGLHVGL